MAGAAEPVSYYDDVRPLFQAKCHGCHQPAKAKGNYVMTDFAKMLAGGEEGAAIVAGEPDESYLVVEITPGEDGEAEMPKKEEALHEVEIAMVRRWIEEGAKDDTPENARQRFDEENPPVYETAPVVTALDFSPDGSLLAVSGYHEVLLHHADGSGLVARLVGLSERIESVRFSPDGTRLAVTGGLPGTMGEVQIWDVAKRKLAMSVPVTFDSVYGASWSPDGTKVAFGCSDNTVRAIDAKSGNEVLFMGSHSEWPVDTVFSVKGDYVVSVGRDMTAKLTKVDEQRFIDNITSITPKALRGGILSVARHPSRDEILFGGADGVPKIYRMHRVKTRQIGDDSNQLWELPGLRGRIFAVDWSRDGTKIAAGSSLDGEGALHVYGIDPGYEVPKDVNDVLMKPTHQRNGEELKRLKKYFEDGVETIATVDMAGSPVYAVSLTDDGKRLAAAGGDGKVRLFSLEEGWAEAGDFVPVPLGSADVSQILETK
ncbi:MAG: hypothetical protein P8J87_06480 [Verrucomicrobiales bacterium]|nr:hypothetical protein [Verrucomicrobiales bacterium]